MNIGYFRMIYFSDVCEQYSLFIGLTSVAMSSGSVLAMVIVTPLCLPSVLGNAELWICLPAICSVMALLHLSIAVFFPQSPKHLYIYNHDTPRSKESVLFYHGSVANFGQRIILQR
uniref:Uncharacterized protein n=1 Tax=Parascaris equorum TaxID=6256 RepID=A0A914RCS0_PAREQ